MSNHPSRNRGSKTREAVKAAMRIEIFKRLEDGWVPPSQHEVSQIFDAAGISDYRAAQITGDNRSTILRWKKEDATHIAPRYSSWRVLCIELGLAETAKKEDWPDTGRRG